MSAHLDNRTIETRLFINGEFVESSKKFPTVNPVTEEVITEVHEADASHVDQAVAAARAAFKLGAKWRTMNATDRRDLMLKLADLMERDGDYIRDLESLDNGKPSAAAGQGYGSAIDLALSIKCIRYYAGWADKIEGKTVPIDGDYLNMTIREPTGVVGVIIPWNFPLLMYCWKLGPMLAAGCTCVIKTSEKTPLTGLHMATLVKEAGFPPGVVNVLSGFGPTAGEPLARHMDVDKVAFTGSTAVGKLIQKCSAESNLKNVTLELGGKSPMVVMDDADLDQAIAACHIGLFLNQGQTCCASSRIFVQESIYDAFVERAKQAAEQLKLGHQFADDTTHGPLVDKIQFDKVMGYLQKGKDEGARCVTGGDRHGDKGFFVQPTVFADVEDHHTIAREEIFGPVMSVMKFKTMEEAIERANDTMYGLAAGVCTRDVGKALRLAKSIRAGTVWVNCFNVFDAASAFGGFNQSGIGRELGEYALNNFLEVKTITIPIDK